MQNSQNTILSDYQEKLAETFEHINYLIDKQLQASPLTIANSIIEDICSRIVNQPTYISSGDFWLRQRPGTSKN